MKFGEFIRADVCQVAVQQVPAHKATLYHRRRKVAEKQLHECKGYSWGTAETLSCMYTSSYTVTSTCMGGFLLCLFFHCLFCKWRRHKGAHPNASRYASRASAVHFKISGKVCKIWRQNKRALDRKIYRLKIWCLVRYYLLYGKLYRTKKRLKKWLTPLVCHIKSAYMRVAFSVYCHLPPLRVSAAVIFLGLFMSGNIELNPGPKERHLTLGDLRVVRKAIWDARSKWFSLGIELSITVTSLEAIKQKNKENADDCLTEMLLEWLRQASPKPTWACIVAALREPTVGLEQLAESVEKEYLIIEGMRGMECTTSESEAACSSGIKLGKRQTRGELCFPHINEIAPDKEQRKALEGRLHIESKEMIYKFYILINKFFDSLEERAIPAQKLERYLRMPLEMEKLTISNVQDAQRIIEDNSSFYDYQLVEYMIEVTGTESDKQALQKYVESFTHYAQRRVFECPAKLATRARTPGDVKLMIKLDAHYKWKLAELKEFQKRICRILRIPFYVSKLHCVKKGCFKITFLIASYIIKEIIFPLNPDQKAALVKLKVIRLVCGKYQEDFRREMDYNIALDSGSDSDSDDDVNCSNPATKSISCETAALDDNTCQILSAELDIHTSGIEQVVMTDESHSFRGERRSSIGRSERRRQTGRSAASPTSTPPLNSSPTRTASPIRGMSVVGMSPRMTPSFNHDSCSQRSNDLLLAAGTGDELRVAILIHLHGVNVSYKDSKGNSALHYATRYGHLKVVVYLIEHGAYIMDRDQDGTTLLHIAAKFGHMHIIHYLINKCNFNPYCFDHCQRTPFFVACMYNNLEIAQYLLTTLLKYKTLEEIVSSADAYGENIIHTTCKMGYIEIVRWLTSELNCNSNIPSSIKRLPLHYAAEFGHVHVVKFLIENQGCNSSCTDSNGATPLLLASKKGHLDTVKYLTMDRHCNPEIRDNDNVTPLHAATKNGHYDIAKFFVSELNYDPNALLHVAACKGYLDIIKYLVEEKLCNPLCQDANKFTPLHLASMNGHLDLVMYLTMKCDPTVRDCDNVTPLHYATMNGHYDVTKYLVSKLNCDPNIRGWKQSGMPLHVAAQEGHLRIVKYLVEELYCNPSCQDANKFTPLHFASRGGRLDIVKYLTVDRHCDPTVRNNKNATPLHIAACNGHYKVVRFLIAELNCDPNIQGWKTKRSPLHNAAQEGHLDIVKYLIEDQGCDPSCRDMNEVTPLHLASYNGHLDIIRYLTINRKCDPAVRHNKNATPLHVAARNGHYEVVKFLISELNCDPNIQGWKTKKSPLHNAAQEGHLDIVKYLIEDQGCDPSCRDIDHVTPLHLASLNGHLDIIRYLTVDRNCDPAVRDNENATPRFLTTRLKVDPNIQGWKTKVTPLHNAAQEGHLDIVKYLIEDQGCDPSCRDMNEVTPLHLASYNGHLDIIRYLTVDRNCDPEVRHNENPTPLHVAACNSHYEVVKFLISELNCDPNIQGWKTKATPLHNAAQEGHLDIVKYLIEDQGCDPSCRDIDQVTPLHLASLNGRPNTVKYLITEQKCNAKCRDVNGITPVLLASHNGHLELVKYLVLDKCYDPMNRTANCNTLLHAASYNGHIDVVKFLISDINCDPSVPGFQGITPLHYAVYSGNISLVRYMIEDIKCNLHVLDNFGRTPIMFAVKSLSCLQYLCEKHCDPTGRTILGETMLHFAAREGHREVINYLVKERYFDPNTQGWTNRTPLHCAAEYGHLDLVKHLISKYNCQVTTTDANGDTPLHFAALQGHLPILKHLTLDLNCDPFQTDNYGNTPLHDAARNGHLEVVRFLVETLRCPTDTRGSCHMTPLEWAFFKGHFHIIKYLCQANTKMISSELNH